MSEQVCKHCGNVIEPDMERRTGWKHVDLMSPTFHPGVCGGKAEREAAPASEAQSGTSALYVTKAAYDVRLAELAQLRARVAILEALARKEGECGEPVGFCNQL